MDEFQLPPIDGDFSALLWITHGKNGRSLPERKRLIDLDIDHLEKILKNVRHIRGTVFERAIRTILEC